ncbi:MAG: acyl transferase [Sphingobacteriales bacterium]|nr:acyl transferase [Sphingobacteriales bacterium]
MYLRNVISASINNIFSITNYSEFEKVALEVFKFQAGNCRVYSDFVKNLGIKPSEINSIKEIPFIPVELFKTHSITSTNHAHEIIFSSSGTTGLETSKHLVTDVSVYEKSYTIGFEKFYGDITHYAILALLPSYQEREGSSLIYMVDDLIRLSKNSSSGYFLYNHSELNDSLLHLKKNHIPTILIGVTYALLDFAESHLLEFPELIVMETGGMKGKRKEMVREELHEKLCSGFGVPTIHSEYGMTELLSQAYSKGGGIFHCPNWMQVYIRDTNDPLTILSEGHTGGINIIDLANINSCSFIATQDLGRKINADSFEVLGRFDNSDIRGCNLLVQ